VDCFLSIEPPRPKGKETTMNIQEYEKLNHSVWECKYHLVFIPKYRKKVLYGALRRQIGSVLRKLAEGKGCQVLEGYVMTDHIHMLISIPPKYRVSDIVGYIKGKNAIHVARHFRGKDRNFTGESFWARGYFISTVGRDEKVIREYIKNQEKEDIRQDELKLTFR
jgi:putative transposase